MSRSKEKKVADIQKVTLSLSQTKELIKHQFRQVIEHGAEYHGLLFFIEAEPGVGKTQMQSQILKEMCEEITGEMAPMLKKRKDKDYEYFMKEQNGQGLLIVNNLAAKDSQDFGGLPLIDMETKKQHFAHPDNIPTDGYGIVFFDEANRVHDLDMKSTLLSLWMDRGVNGHHYGKGYIQVAAGNPFSDDRFETGDPDAALAERFRIIRLVPTVPEVITFLESRYGSHFLLDYFKENQDLCNINSGELGYSPRTIDKAMEITFSLKDDHEKNLGLIKTLLTTYFSSSDSAKIVKFLNNIKDLSLERIIKDNSLAKKIKTSDVPMMTSIAKEIFALTKKHFEEKTHLSKAEKKAFDVVEPYLKAEAKGVFLNCFLAEPNGGEIMDFLILEHKEFMKTMKEMGKEF